MCLFVCLFSLLSANSKAKYEYKPIFCIRLIQHADKQVRVKVSELKALVSATAPSQCLKRRPRLILPKPKLLTPEALEASFLVLVYASLSYFVSSNWLSGQIC